MEINHLIYTNMKTKITRFAIVCATIFSMNCFCTFAESVDCTSLITNPNFEDGLDGWTVVANTFTIESWGIGTDGGSKSAGMSGKVSPSISQSITTENGNYTLSLMYTAKNFGDGAKPTVSINGKSLFTFSDGKAQTATITFSVTEGKIDLVISGQDLEKGTPYLNIDNFKLTLNTTPEPPIGEDVDCTSAITNPNFENGLNGWTVVANTFTVESWGLGTDGGNKSVGMSGKVTPSLSQKFQVDNGSYTLTFIYTAKNFGNGIKPTVSINGTNLFTFNDGKNQTAILKFNVSDGVIDLVISGQDLSTENYPYLNIDNFKLIRNSTPTSITEAFTSNPTIYFANGILYGNNLVKDMILNIYDMQGKKVYSENITNEMFCKQLSLAQGIYFIVINHLKWKIKI